MLFSPKQRTKPGPKGPAADLIRTVVEMKKRNPTWGCPQIADQINLAFGTSINNDVVRRILWFSRVVTSALRNDFFEHSCALKRENRFESLRTD
jgi:hypothetical protein